MGRLLRLLAVQVEQNVLVLPVGGAEKYKPRWQYKPNDWHVDIDNASAPPTGSTNEFSWERLVGGRLMADWFKRIDGMGRLPQIGEASFPEFLGPVGSFVE